MKTYLWKYPDRNSYICKLEKSLYGIKHAAKCWIQKFTVFFRKFNLVPSEVEKCISAGEFEIVEVFLALFVDDGLKASKSSTILQQITQTLNSPFEITLGDPSKFVDL